MYHVSTMYTVKQYINKSTTRKICPNFLQKCFVSDITIFCKMTTPQQGGELWQSSAEKL